MSEEITFQGWDRGIDYEEAKTKFIGFIEFTRDRREKAFGGIALVQLMNGTRRNEALAACFQWAKDGKREQRVRVEKRKDKYMRLVRIPQIFNRFDSLKKAFKELEKEAYPEKAYYYFCTREFGHNTHCLRYSFIGYMSDKLHPQAIAKLTGHTKLDLVLHYTQNKQAEAKLREIVP